MSLDIALLLAQDGLTNGTIYALLALAIVMVFTVTRIILVPQGEFVSYGALTLASFQLGKIPAVVWLVLAAGWACLLLDCVHDLRRGRRLSLLYSGATNVVLPTVAVGLIFALVPQHPPLWVLIVLTLLLIVPSGPMLYRLAFQPLQNASVLILLIVAVAVEFVLMGFGLYFFGAEGARTPVFSDASLGLGGMTISAQSLIVLGTSVMLAAIFYAIFEHTMIGKALRAIAFNRVGARLVGISPTLAGKIVFAATAAAGTLSGILIGPISTMNYDTGFVIGLKGFVGALIGGFAVYPLAALGAIFIGLLESFSSFWASGFKEAIVFTLVIPLLLVRNLYTPAQQEEEE